MEGQIEGQTLIFAQVVKISAQEQLKRGKALANCFDDLFIRRSVNWYKLSNPATRGIKVAYL